MGTFSVVEAGIRVKIGRKFRSPPLLRNSILTQF
jgi:hypothetical protein